jgi:hypothetical protein
MIPHPRNCCRNFNNVSPRGAIQPALPLGNQVKDRCPDENTLLPERIAHKQLVVAFGLSQQLKARNWKICGKIQR